MTQTTSTRPHRSFRPFTLAALMALLTSAFVLAAALTPNDLLSLIGAGQYRAAAQGLQSAVSARGVSRKSLQVQAALDYKTGRLEEARTDLQSAAALPGSGTLLNAETTRAIRLGTPLGPKDLDRAVQQGYAADVMDDLEAAVAAHPDRAEAHLLYAQAAARTGQTILGREQLALARTIDPDLSVLTDAARSDLERRLGTGQTNQPNGNVTVPTVPTPPARASEPAKPFVWPLWATLALIVTALIAGATALFLRRAHLADAEKSARQTRLLNQGLLQDFDRRMEPVVMDLELRALTDETARTHQYQYAEGLAGLYAQVKADLLRTPDLQVHLASLEALIRPASAQKTGSEGRQASRTETRPANTPRSPQSQAAQSQAAQSQAPRAPRAPQPPAQVTRRTSHDDVVIIQTPVIYPVPVPAPTLPDSSFRAPATTWSDPAPEAPQSSFRNAPSTWDDAPTRSSFQDAPKTWDDTPAQTRTESRTESPSDTGTSTSATDSGSSPSDSVSANTDSGNGW